MAQQVLQVVQAAYDEPRGPDRHRGDAHPLDEVTSYATMADCSERMRVSAH